LEHSGRLLPSILDAARSLEPLPLSDGQQRRDFTYVEEVVEGLLRLAVSDVRPGEIVNLATGVMHSVRDFVHAAAAVVKCDESLLHFGAVPHRPEEMSHEGVSVSRLRTRADWLPADDITEGVARTVGRLAELSARQNGARGAATSG
ncbi:MAG: GDP-mannose 4,6-dehydratase, partial [Gemmatimonadaceae bacterium]